MRKLPTIFTNPINNSITLSLQSHKCSLIWLHGLGDKAQGFMSFFSHSHSPLYTGTRIKLIQAPQRPITVNNGALMNSWYDIKSMKRFTGDESKVFDFDHVEESVKVIEEHVNEEVKYWRKQQPSSQINPLHRVFVGGFSQGGVMSLHYAMQAKNIPAGVVALSSYLLRSTPLSNHKKFPILLMHGQQDSVINEIQAKHSYQRILGESAIIEYHKVKGLDHTVRLQQLNVIKTWLSDVNQMLNVHYNKGKESNVKTANLE